MPQNNPSGPAPRLDPVGDRNLTFIFTQCQARLEGDDLLVTVPLPSVTVRGAGTGARSVIAWSTPIDVTREVAIECVPGPRRRTDGREYPVSDRYPDSVIFRFQGGYSYGRLALPNGWALGVQAPVRVVKGLPSSWTSWEAVLVQTAAGWAETQPASAAAPMTMMAAAAPGDPPPDDSVSGPHLPYP